MTYEEFLAIHEELLAKIDALYKNEGCTAWICEANYKSLRAVVELHKPRQEMTGWGTDTEPTYKTVCGCCNVNFPCNEFQIIKKELK